MEESTEPGKGPGPGGGGISPLEVKEASWARA